MVATTNLVSYYKFEGNADDSKGSNDGTVNGATSTSGKIFKGYSFDGNTNYISMGSASFLNNTSGTISIWANLKDVVSGDCLFGAGTSSSNLDFISCVIRRGGTGSNNDRLNFYNYKTDSVYALITPEDSLTFTNAFTHFVFVSDGSSTKIYINGSEQTLTVSSGSNNGAWFGDNTNLNEFSIGRVVRSVNDIAKFTGAIDEVGIWSEALDSTSISELYNDGLGLTYDSTSDSFIENSLGSDLISYYKFDTDADDSNGSNDGTVTGATLTTSDGGVIDEAYSFDGSNDNIAISGQGLKDISGNFSVSLWIKRNGAQANGGYATFISRGTWSNAGFWGIRYENPTSSYKISFDIYSSSGTNSITSSNAFDDDNWHFITSTYKHSNREFKIYVDGSLEGTATLGANTFTSYNVNTNIGRRNNADRPFKGYIDEVGIWTSVLTSDEVESLYNSGSGYAYPFTSAPSGPQVAKINDITVSNVITIG